MIKHALDQNKHGEELSLLGSVSLEQFVIKLLESCHRNLTEAVIHRVDDGEVAHESHS